MVPLSLRMAAKGGGQGHNSLRSDKCPLSSNASVREPSGTRSPDQCTPERKLTAVYCRWDARAGRIAEEMQMGARAGRIAEGMQMGRSWRAHRWEYKVSFDGFFPEE